VVIEWYKGVNGGSSVGSAGSLVAVALSCYSNRKGHNTHHIPPTFSLASNATILHKPTLNCGVSKMTLMAARPEAPQPTTQMDLRTSLDNSRDIS
jgi:hypothetical protein